MANVIPWNDLDKHMGELIYEEWKLKEQLNQCTPIEYLDITHMKFDRNGLTVMERYTPMVRYWDAPPTKEERSKAYWG